MQSCYYVVWVLRHSKLPEFKKLGFRDKNQKPESWYRGFDETFKDFYHQADLNKLWLESSKLYLKKIEGYKKEVPAIIKNALSYLRVEKIRNFNEVILIPNLLITGGFGPLMDKKAIIIIDPFGYKKKIYFNLITHEFLHSIVNPLTDERVNKKIINNSKSLYKKLTTNTSRKHYPEWWMIVNEYLIRAIQGRLFNKSNLKSYIVIQKKRGFPYIKWFLIQISFYEKSRSSFEDYLQKILHNLKELKK